MSIWIRNCKSRWCPRRKAFYDRDGRVIKADIFKTRDKMFAHRLRSKTHHGGEKATAIFNYRMVFMQTNTKIWVYEVVKTILFCLMMDLCIATDQTQCLEMTQHI